MDLNRRTEATQAILKAVRTAEDSAAKYASTFMAETVTMTIGERYIEGVSAVRHHLTSHWPLTPVYQRGAWSMPSQVADGSGVMQVVGRFPGVGAAPLSTKLCVEFTDSESVASIEIVSEPDLPPEPAAELSSELRAIINNALSNGTPIIVGYVDDMGKPNLSPRGSIQCLSGTQLCLWARSPTGGLVMNLPHRPALSLLYRDSRTRTTLVISGTGRIAPDDTTREKVFQLSPEVEKNHDPARRGAAILIDIERIVGSSPSGPVLVQPAGDASP